MLSEKPPSLRLKGLKYEFPVSTSVVIVTRTRLMILMDFLELLSLCMR